MLGNIDASRFGGMNFPCRLQYLVYERTEIRHNDFEMKDLREPGPRSGTIYNCNCETPYCAAHSHRDQSRVSKILKGLLFLFHSFIPMLWTKSKVSIRDEKDIGDSRRVTTISRPVRQRVFSLDRNSAENGSPVTIVSWGSVDEILFGLKDHPVRP